mmetsp:Transcript_33174/g.57307  ORF Transcript_33174/g.57307 Transcript_33174/m.57307 type:complete len:88 (+) Transcript_33174:432-695(+)
MKREKQNSKAGARADLDKAEKKRKNKNNGWTREEKINIKTTTREETRCTFCFLSIHQSTKWQECKLQNFNTSPHSAILLLCAASFLK